MPEYLDVTVQLWEPVRPLDRLQRYEEPVAAALERAGLGSAGDGGGSLCSKDGEILEVDFDVALVSFDGIDVIARALEAAGAPKGTEIRFVRDGESQTVVCGTAEGVAVYLDGTTLPQEVYSTSSLDALAEQLMVALVGRAEIRGSWSGPRETSLYFYGADAEVMFTKMEPVLRRYLLAQNARVVIRHGKASLSPREVRLPMHAPVSTTAKPPIVKVPTPPENEKAKPAAKPKAKAKPAAKTKPKTKAKAKPTAKTKPQAKAKPTAKTKPKPKAKAKTKPKTKAKPKSKRR